MFAANEMTELDSKIMRITDLSGLEYWHRMHCMAIAKNGPGCECVKEHKQPIVQILFPYRHPTSAQHNMSVTDTKILFSKCYVSFLQGPDAFRHHEIIELNSNSCLNSSHMQPNRQIHFILLDEKEFTSPWIVRKSVVKFLCNKETSIARLSVPYEHSDQATCTRYVPLFNDRNMNLSECKAGSVRWARYSLFEFTQSDLKVNA